MPAQNYIAIIDIKRSPCILACFAHAVAMALLLSDDIFLKFMSGTF